MPWLPDRLTADPQVLWERALPHSGLGGIAATDRYVVFGDRDFEDFFDEFHCLDANSGETLWSVKRLAIGSLDYGNSPRATPLVDGTRVICLGAFGALLCINLEDGEVIWERNLGEEFKLDGELPWGYCGSPILVDGKLILCPGSPDASVVAMDPATGELLWKTAGIGPSYGSLNVLSMLGKKQLIGHDAKTLGGWDLQTGQRLWTIEPEVPGDFNVPTPIVYHNQMLITTENNAARLYAFDSSGMPQPDPIAVNTKLRPDMSTAVVVNDLVFCVKGFLFCLDLKDELKERWRLRDRSLSDYASLIASQTRLLVIGNGELLLFGTDGHKDVLSRQRIFDDSNPIYSHPAMVDTRLFIRGESKIQCIDLAAQ